VDKPESVSPLELPRKSSNPSSSSPTKFLQHRKPLQYSPIDRAYRDTSDSERIVEANDSSHTCATGGLSSDEDRGRGNVTGTSKSKNGLKAVVSDLQAGLRELPTSMRSVMMVMALTWVRTSWKILVFVFSFLFRSYSSYSRNKSGIQNHLCEFVL
jgi:hypothetical protein